MNSPIQRLLGVLTLLALAPFPAGADYIQPQLGGGSPGGPSAPMKHADVWFDYLFTDTVEVVIDTSVATPRLWPTLPTDGFDPAGPWDALNGKAYNAQYGWNPNGFVRLPAGAAFWIEQTGSSEGLEVYQAPPESPAGEPIFGTAGSSTLWKWSTTRMVHNYYAVEDVTSGPHWASYRVYVGDAETGAPNAAYTAAEVTFNFATPGDFDGDGVVGPADHALWASQFGGTGVKLAADGNGDGVIDAADYTVWRDNAATPPVSVPEPAGIALLAALAGQVISTNGAGYRLRRSRRRRAGGNIPAATTVRVHNDEGSGTDRSAVTVPETENPNS